jgi:hypothetical protein
VATLNVYPLDAIDDQGQVLLNDDTDPTGQTQVPVDWLVAGYAAGDLIDGNGGKPSLLYTIKNQDGGSVATCLVRGVDTAVDGTIPAQVHPLAVSGNAFASMFLFAWNAPVIPGAYTVLGIYTEPDSANHATMKYVAQVMELK